MIATTAIHIFSDTIIEPAYATDNSGSVLIKDGLEVQGNIFAQGAGFYPRTLEQNGEPAAGTGATQIDSGEMIIWIDSNDSDRSYLMYNYGGAVTKIELV